MTCGCRINFRFDDRELYVNFKNIQVVQTGEVLPYNGPYVITPKSKTQVLETKDLQMLDDLTVLDIPFWEVDNESQGQTVIIGGDI